jgi:hypothetical protein
MQDVPLLPVAYESLVSPEVVRRFAATRLEPMLKPGRCEAYVSSRCGLLFDPDAENYVTIDEAACHLVT